jgi:hypothetical protein
LVFGLRALLLIEFGFLGGASGKNKKAVKGVLGGLNSPPKRVGEDERVKSSAVGNRGNRAKCHLQNFNAY